MSEPALVPVDPPSPRLAEAKAELAACRAALDEVSARQARVAGTAKSEALKADLAKLDRDNAEALRRWAGSGASGERPAHDGGHRAHLLEEIALAEVEEAAAQRVAADLSAAVREAQARMTAAAAAVEEAVADVVAAELAPFVEELEAVCARRLELLAKAAALPEYMRRLARQRQQRPGDASAQGLFARAERLETVIAAAAIHQTTLTGAQLTAAVAGWAARAAELQR